jgi:hypothetical protein
VSIVEPSLVAILAVTRINVPALIDSVSDVSDNHKTKPNVARDTLAVGDGG